MCGQVFDVSNGREFYGRGGPYHALTGRDATRMLAKGLLEPETAEEATVPLKSYELEQLAEWRSLYETKYVRLGPLSEDAGTRASQQEQT